MPCDGSLCLNICVQVELVLLFKLLFCRAWSFNTVSLPLFSSPLEAEGGVFVVGI